MSIVVYQSQFPFTRDARVRWALEELDVAYTTETVQLLAEMSVRNTQKGGPGWNPPLARGDGKMISR